MTQSVGFSFDTSVLDIQVLSSWRHCLAQEVIRQCKERAGVPLRPDEGHERVAVMTATIDVLVGYGIDQASTITEILSTNRQNEKSEELKYNKN